MARTIGVHADQIRQTHCSECEGLLLGNVYYLFAGHDKELVVGLCFCSVSCGKKYKNKEEGYEDAVINNLEYTYCNASDSTLSNETGIWSCKEDYWE